ncbi:hypothetical protein HF086_016025 [Spodoptera exigua]|uniref:Uncharacterized protein n=1 Tax=Spodoptera exigua TaxID=7107 RepID=A0A922MNH3_SPOEX|nr:hypothetical protein HF086_016025 [Spodoptera exigua]
MVTVPPPLPQRPPAIPPARITLVNTRGRHELPRRTFGGTHKAVFTQTGTVTVPAGTDPKLILEMFDRQRSPLSVPVPPQPAAAETN